MKTKKLDTHCEMLVRGAMAIVVGAAIGSAGTAQAAATGEVVPAWIVVADAPLPASSVSIAAQPGQGEAGATGEVAG
ncbi:MAG TPA: hypothetical protein VGL08_13285, partial [Paraburkholderia sp.]